MPGSHIEGSCVPRGGLISDKLNPDVLHLDEDEYEYDFPKPERRAEAEILDPLAFIYQLKPLKDQMGQVFLNGVPVTARVQGTERFTSGSKVFAGQAFDQYCPKR
nr:PREDICTED: phospholipase D2-like isoform X2 [Latimeria chalumnae]|eukprot:XP_014350607.1 PREDICTED: phospholipase D2-like isoform X2 [Latimeria chalumnae]